MGNLKQSRLNLSIFSFSWQRSIAHRLTVYKGTVVECVTLNITHENSSRLTYRCRNYKTFMPQKKKEPKGINKNQARQGKKETTAIIKVRMPGRKQEGLLQITSCLSTIPTRFLYATSYLSAIVTKSSTEKLFLTGRNEVIYLAFFQGEFN